ncbi:hypothetical protein NIES2101_42455 [Calothrix sp. HK-06]|nr:hypothetical protein NIES2101_42455 [Calothrix sp. HK-06]
MSTAMQRLKLLRGIGSKNKIKRRLTTSFIKRKILMKGLLYKTYRNARGKESGSNASITPTSIYLFKALMYLIAAPSQKDRRRASSRALIKMFTKLFLTPTFLF